MKTSIHHNYVNLLKDLFTKYEIKVQTVETKKSKDAVFLERVIFSVVSPDAPNLVQYNLIFIHRLVFDAGVPIYSLSTPHTHLALNKKPYEIILAKLLKRAGYTKL